MSCVVVTLTGHCYLLTSSELYCTWLSHVSSWRSHARDTVLLLLLLTAAKNGVVIAVEKKHKSPLYDESTVNKVCLLPPLALHLITMYVV